MSLKIYNLQKQFGGDAILKGISFNVEAGRPFGLLGRNGAGKTTAIRMIMNIIKRDGGSITWDGEDIARSGVRIGYLPEERGLYVKNEVFGQLEYFCLLRGMSAEQAGKAVGYWLEKLGVSEYASRKVETLSKGNQQKIQLAAAVLHDPELIILDEPFSGLDPVNADMFRSIIAEFTRQGRHLIISSHIMGMIEELCQDIAIIDQGRLLLQGSLASVKEAYGRSLHQIFVEKVGEKNEAADTRHQILL